MNAGGETRVRSNFQPLQHRDGPVRVFDNVLSPQSLQRVESEVKTYLSLPGSDTVVSNSDGKVQVTRYIAKGELPRCAIECAVIKLAEVTGADQAMDFDGCEWWIQWRSSDEPQPFHFDADVGLQARESEGGLLPHDPPLLRYPSLSSVLYLSGSDSAGGPTVVVRSTLAFDQIKTWIPPCSAYFTPVLEPAEPAEAAFVYPGRGR